MNASVYAVAVTVHVKAPESAPPSAHVLASPVSESVIAIAVSTAVEPSATLGVVSVAAYVGVWSLTSVTVTVSVVAPLASFPTPSSTSTVTV